VENAVGKGGFGPSTTSRSLHPSSGSGDFSRPQAVGPSFPSQSYDSADDDEDIGPKPGPSGSDQPDPISEFLKKEERRKKVAQVELCFFK